MIDFEAFFKITYGLFIISSGDMRHGNGFISNTVFQVASSPPRFVVVCNRDNFTADFIKNYSETDIPGDRTFPICGSEKSEFIEV